MNAEIKAPYARSYLNVLSCDDEDIRVLHSLRFRDQDLSIKCGAMLAFSALLIACALVVLSAPADSHLYAPAGGFETSCARLSAWLGIAAAALAAAAIVFTRLSYADEAVPALNQYANVLQIKGRLLTFAVTVSAAQLAGLLGALFPLLA